VTFEVLMGFDGGLNFAKRRVATVLGTRFSASHGAALTKKM